MLLHNRGVDEDDLKRHNEDWHPHDEGDSQADAKIVQKHLEKGFSINDMLISLGHPRHKTMCSQIFSLSLA